MPIIRQIDEMDCGAACLAMVTRAFGRRVSLARIRQLINTGLDGTSLRSICRAGEELGLATRSVKASVRHLERMPLPAIVHWDDYHWVVLTRVGRRHVWMADPAVGRRRLTREQFLEKWSGYAALFDYTPAFEQAPESARMLDWMWPLVRPHRGLLLQALGLAVVVSALQMVLPIFTQVIVDRVLVEQDLALLHLLIAGMGVTMVFIVASLLVQRYLLSYAAVRIDASSLDLLTRRLLALPMSYFATRRTGDLQRRLEGVRLVRDFLVQHGIAGITGIAQLAATVAVMLAYSPWLTLVFLATAPLYAALMVAATKMLRPTFVELEESFSKYHSYQIDAIKGIETVKALGGESAFRRLLLDQFLGVARKIFRADYFAMTYEGAVEAVTFLGVGLFLWAGAYQVLDGRLSIGGLVAFNSLVALATVPISNLLSLWDNLQRCEVLLNRLDDVFQHVPEQGYDRSVLRPVRTVAGQVSLRGVGFRYGGPEAPSILEGLTVDVPAGQDRGHRRAERFGQDHPGQVHGRTARAHRGHDSLRRDGPEDAQLPRPAPPDRHRAAGCVRVRRLHRQEHRVRRGRARHDAGSLGGRGGERPRVHRATARSASTPGSARPGWPCRAASGSASRSPGRSTTSRRF